MISVFEQPGHYGQRITCFDSANLASMADSVTSAVMESVSTTSNAAAARKGRARPFKINKTEPDWSSAKVVSGTIMTHALPPSVEHITRMKPLETTHKPCMVQVADCPFDKGTIRLAYYGRRLFPAKAADEVRERLQCQDEYREFRHDAMGNLVLKECGTPTPMHPYFAATKFEQMLLYILLEVELIDAHQRMLILLN
jgi:hypothetical protein